MLDKKVKEKVIELLKFLYIGDKVEYSDIILGLGSIDYKVAEKCAELYNNGFGKYIIFTGNCGKGTVGIIKNTEAENFRDIAIKNGVPSEKIFLEKDATTTFENYVYSREIIKENNLPVNSVIVVQKPYVERRSKAIAEKFLRDKKLYITSPEFEIEKFDKYYIANKYTNIEEIVNEIVAEIDINTKAPRYNLQVYQEIPKTIIEIFEELVSMGYSKYLIPEVTMENYERKIQYYLCL